MNTILKALVALVIGAIVAALATYICRHFAIDEFWGVLVGIIAGIAYFIGGPVLPNRVQ